MLDLKFHLQKEQKINKMHTVIIVVTIILVFLTIFFVDYILSNEFISAKQYLEQSVLQTASNMRGRISNSVNELRLLSRKLADSSEELSDSVIADFLSKNIKDYEYQRLIYSYPDGRLILIQKNHNNLSYPSYTETDKFKNTLKGKSVYVSTAQEKSVSSGYVKNFAVPVYDKNNNISGAISSQVDASVYLSILRFNSFDEKGISSVIDSKGNYIIKPSNADTSVDNFFENNIKYFGTTKDKILKLIKTKKHGIFTFSMDKTKYIASFAYIYTDTYVLTIVPLQVLMLHVDKMLTIVVIIVLIISALLLFLTYYSNRIFKQNEKIIYEIGFTDEVTGYGNKNKFRLAARELLDRSKDENYAVISIDITKFRAINELYGIEQANIILKDILEIINKNLTEGSICVRDYAATYIVLYKYEAQESIVKSFIENIVKDVNEYCEKEMAQTDSDSDMVLKSSKLKLTFGIYIIADKTLGIDQMCERAYIAKRNVKEELVEDYKFYDDDLRAKLLHEKIIEDEMVPALKNKQFQMYLQPKFSLSDMKLCGAEALVRWVHPKKGIIYPSAFIDLFEHNGFIIELDRYVWEQACMFLSERQKEGKELFPISVNVSRLHFYNDSFISDLNNLTNHYAIDNKYLELELTESLCFNNDQYFFNILQALKAHNYTISIDDFGTGYSSLNMLRDFPVDVLKLDRGFLKDAIKNEKGYIVIKNIINLANDLQIRTLAEGIENEEQAQFLRNIGCQIGQGFLYGKPVDVETFISSFLTEEVTK